MKHAAHVLQAWFDVGLWAIIAVYDDARHYGRIVLVHLGEVRQPRGQRRKRGGLLVSFGGSKIHAERQTRRVGERLRRLKRTQVG
jgi:hypothetical protein